MGRNLSKPERYFIAATLVLSSGFGAFLLFRKLKQTTVPKESLLGASNKTQNNRNINNFKEQLESKKNRDYESNINQLRKIKHQLDAAFKTSLEGKSLFSDSYRFIRINESARGHFNYTQLDIPKPRYCIYILSETLRSAKLYPFYI